MLQRSVDHSIRRIRLLASPETAAVCQVAYGGRFPRNASPSTPARRAYSSARQAPQIWNKTRERKAGVTPEERKEYKVVLKEIENNLSQEFRRLEGRIRLMVANREMSCSSRQGIDFLREMCTRGTEVNYDPRAPMNADAHLKLMQQYALTHADVVRIGVAGRRERGWNEQMGDWILASASNAGNEEATIRIMARALTLSQDRPEILKAVNLVKPRAHVDQIARRGDDYRAMVLAGKLAHAKGNVNRAIEMFAGAMEGAVEAERARTRAMNGGRTSKALDHLDFKSLSTPWLDLQLLYIGQKNDTGAQWAIDAGCKLDDPISHYYAALMAKRTDNHGNHVGTSKWLFHMTKAAASGYVKAIHELGVWYAQSGWRYIEDEPPDHVKPTPFDRYPAEGKTTSSTSLWERLRTAAGYESPASDNEAADLFYTAAAFPSTAQERMKMALEWLAISMDYNYAPSFLYAARIRLEDTVWGEATAPMDAMNLSKERYEYASKEDYDDRKPLERKRAREKPKDPSNPCKDVDRAKELVHEIFYANEALKSRQEAFRKYQLKLAQNRGNNNGHKELPELEIPQNIPPQVRKWLRVPKIRDMFMDGKRGVLFDDTTDPELNLLQEAKKMCDENGWTIYADWDGGLLYKPAAKSETRATSAGA